MAWAGAWEVEWEEAWEVGWEGAWEVGWAWEAVIWEEEWAVAWAVEWEGGEDGMAEECDKGAWTEGWEEEWEVARDQEEEVGLVNNPTLVVSRGDSGQGVATQAPLSGVVASNRGGAEVSTEVVGGGFKKLQISHKNVPLW